MKYLDARLRLPDGLLHPMQAFIRHEDAVSYEEMRAWNVRSTEDLQYALYYVEADLDAYRAAVDGVETIVDYRLSRIDEGAAHLWVCEEIRPEDRELFSAFVDRHLIVVPPIRFDADATMAMTIVGDGGDIQGMLDALPAAVDVTVDEVGTYDRQSGTVAAGLTDRQLAAVGTAFELGYYEVPREVTLDEVAAELDCTRSTASVLLRRAERTVFARILDRYGGTEGERGRLDGTASETPGPRD